MSYGLNFMGAEAYSPDVEAAQRALVAAGFNKGKDGKPLKTDGIEGPNTDFAVAAFWASRGASHAARVDADLLAALGVKAAPPAPRPAAPAPAPAPAQPAAAPGQEAAQDPAAPKKTSPLVYAGAALAALAVGGIAVAATR